jgi:hypothetical protein
MHPTEQASRIYIILTTNEMQQNVQLVSIWQHLLPLSTTHHYTREMFSYSPPVTASYGQHWHTTNKLRGLGIEANYSLL